MTPYYQDEWVTIYHGDCRDILPELPKVDLVLTDPPYGVGASLENFVNGNRQHAITNEYGDWDNAIPSRDCFDALFNVSNHQIIWGGNYFISYLSPTRCFLVWDKTIHGNSYADCEMAWTSFNSNARIKALNMVEVSIDGRKHPTQKPLKLMKWCLSLSPESKSILDPFMGSGTTIIASKELNRHSIGIEIEEKYCEIAAKRCSQGVFDLRDDS